MIVVRFKMKAKPETTDSLRAALVGAVAPSRSVEGVLHFDIAQDITDPASFIATEVFENRDALDRQEALPVVQAVLALLPDVLADPPEASVFEVAAPPSGS
jgi:quinol monooxygenase YgiN